MQKKLLAILGIVITAALVLAACQPTNTAQPTPETIIETVIVEEQVVVTEVVTEFVEVEAPVDRNGAWLDTIIMIAEPSTESAVARIIADDIDVYAQSAESTEAFATIEAEGLNYINTVGSYNEITYNPVLELNDGSINPFGVPAIREATNKLVDRNYIAQEILGGLALPKTTPMTGVFPDYANFAAVAREIEAKYAYDPEAAVADIAVEMEALGAEMVDGVWGFDGEPLELIFLIRTEDSRLQMGDYVANQLETAGFAVLRDYKTSSEASPLWLFSDPADGLWHLYTGGWITTAIDRNQVTLLGDYYTELGWPGNPLWTAYQPTDEFFAIADALYNSAYSSVEERAELFTEGLYLALEDSARIWLVDVLSYSPFDTDVSATYDLAAGISGTPLYAHTLRFEGKVGGELVYAMADLLVDPWNPLGGSNWIYDAASQRAVGDFGTIADPYTGLALPQRVESAAVTIEEGLPVGVTYDWVTLDFAPEIVVPDDAWVDWNAADQVFVTAAEKLAAMAEEAAPAEGEEVVEGEEAAEGEEAEETEEAEVPTAMTAKVRSVVTYPADLFETVKYHHGSPISVADFVMAMILTFDPAMEDSPIFDESQVGSLASFMSSFKGIRIASTDPLVIEYYTDNWQLDAENNVASFYPGSWYPFGEGSWDMMAIGILAETDLELAFSADKAESNDIEYMSYISGPSLEVLRAKLDTAIEENFIPYEATLGNYITADEAAERYGNLLDWYRTQGHFWVNTGPYYLNKVFPVEKTLTLTRFQDYPDPSDKWAGFGTPQIADVELDGPGRVTIGEEAVFDAYVTFEGEAYPSGDVKEVKYLVFDATGALVDSGLAEMVEEGLYSVTLSADITGALEAGSNKIEFVVVPLVVSIPTFEAFEFVTAE